MRREEVSQILLSSQFAHDRGDGQFGKNTLSLQTQRQEIGEHFDQQSGVQTVALEVTPPKVLVGLDSLGQNFRR